MTLGRYLSCLLRKLTGRFLEFKSLRPASGQCRESEPLMRKRKVVFEINLLLKDAINIAR